MGRSQQFRRDAERADPRFGVGADDSGCPILHVDMDAFFAAVEVQRRPELRGKPVIVGGTGPRGVVSSASYEARAYGVRSAMPAMRARSLCRNAIFLPPNFAAYSAASEAVMGIFRSVTPLVEPLSLDEAFLDVSGGRRLFGTPTAIAAHIRATVSRELGLSCSVGVAPTKFVAKVASARAKPDGVLVVAAPLVLAFLHPLPIEALWGVGEKAAEKMHRWGLRTVADIAAAPIGMLRQAVGSAAAEHLAALARGQDPRPVESARPDRSVGAEVTFDVDIDDPVELRRALLRLSDRVAVRLRAGGHVGRTVALKVRLPDFTTLNRSRTLSSATDVGREIFAVAWELLEVLRGIGPQRRGPQVGQVRLLGVRVESLGSSAQAARQPVLGEPEHGWREAERAADAAAARFGRSVITPASLLRSPGAQSVENTPPPSGDPLSDPPSPS